MDLTSVGEIFLWLCQAPLYKVLGNTSFFSSKVFSFSSLQIPLVLWAVVCWPKDPFQLPSMLLEGLSLTVRKHGLSQQCVVVSTSGVRAFPTSLSCDFWTAKCANGVECDRPPGGKRACRGTCDVKSTLARGVHQLSQYIVDQCLSEMLNTLSYQWPWQN